ncbi:MAG: ATP-binding protein [Bacteroidia bacterium]
MDSEQEVIEQDILPESHVSNLNEELEWLFSVISHRINYKGNDEKIFSAPELCANSAYGGFVSSHHLNQDERLVLALTLAVHLRPALFDLFITDKKNHQASRLYKSQNDISLLPTAETALYLIAGNDLAKRLKAHEIFDPEHLFYKQSVIDLGETTKGQSIYEGVLSLSSSFRDLFITNKYRKPRFSPDFPAHLLTTKLEWDDMILAPLTREKLDEVQAFLEYAPIIAHDWGMNKHAREGCRILFFGESGTGKTLAASLLGKHLGKEVYRVDISAVTSKYVGETTKRLDSLFNMAESKGWIIFIDEGDALLGQRKSTEADTGSNSHYANQDVAFLLQRIENYDGVIVIATNLKNNIDQAFTRRFQAMVRFYTPDAEMLFEFWKKNLPAKCPIDPGIDLPLLIKRHPLTPASIMNVIFRVCVLTMKNKQDHITFQNLEKCIKDEEFKYMGRQGLGT